MKHFITILIFLFSISNLNAQTKRMYASFGHCRSRDYEKYKFIQRDTITVDSFKKVKYIILNNYSGNSCKLINASLYIPCKRCDGNIINLKDGFYDTIEYQNEIKNLGVSSFRVLLMDIEFECGGEIIKVEGSIDISFIPKS